MKSNKLLLELTLTFSGKLTDKQKSEVTQRVFHSLVSEVNSYGFVPDDCKQFTETIKVFEPEFDTEFSINLMTGEPLE